MMSNKGLLAIILVVLVGIMVLLVTDHGKNDDTIGGSVSEVVEEIGDEIDDHTDAR